MNPTTIFDVIETDMGRLDQEMARALHSDHDYLQTLHGNILSNPGKRLRPALLFLCSKFLGYSGDLAATYAATFELIHTATLIHDDVIDGAVVRRGKATLNEEGRNTMTVLYGDLLYTKANSMAIQAGNLQILRIISDVTERMVEGELLQERINFSLDQNQITYFDILKRKTASLFAGTTETAAILADCDSRETKAMREFGFNLGISFQLIDDYLDYMESEEQLGKPSMSDLREGKLTLPMLRLLEAEPDRARTLTARFWQHSQDSTLQEIMDLMHQHEILEKVRQEAAAYADAAIQYLTPFAHNAYKEILNQIPVLMANRRK
ncbi:MAG: polyprenyl synthetase family protein [Acidobacteria bacterium]|nr:polyprenyl synthetase family protein [Acidobacteriota bacterium]